MECLVGSAGVAHLDAETGFILTSNKNVFARVVSLQGPKLQSLFFFSFPVILLSRYINHTTFSTGEHIVALYIGILTIEIKHVSPGPCSWI